MQIVLQFNVKLILETIETFIQSMLVVSEEYHIKAEQPLKVWISSVNPLAESDLEVIYFICILSFPQLMFFIR